MLREGEKVLVITRRLFEKDLRRHFIGEVQEVSDEVVRVRGYAFVFDEPSSDFVRREDLRTRVFSLIDAGYIINVLPAEVIPEEMRYEVDERNRRKITDGKSFAMIVSEFGAYR